MGLALLCRDAKEEKPPFGGLKGGLEGMSIFYTILYISAFSAFRAYEVGGAEIGVTENLFSGATPIFASTALLSESRIVLFESAN